MFNREKTERLERQKEFDNSFKPKQDKSNILCEIDLNEIFIKK